MRQHQNRNRMIIIFEVISFIILFIILYRMYALQNELYIYSKEKSNMIKLADRLRHSSDDLTHFARTYVVTLDKVFLERYKKVLDIRDGKVPRPKRYNGIYWDLKKSVRENRYPNSKSISLKKLISQLPYSKEEIDKLYESEKESNNLAIMEQLAFDIIEDDVDFQSDAIESLHDNFYYDSKHSIMNPLDEFITLLEDRTQKELKDIRDKLSLNFVFLLIIFIIIIVGNFIVFNTIKDILNKIIKDKTKKLVITNNKLRKTQEDIKNINKNLQIEIDEAIIINQQQQSFIHNQSRLAQMGEMLSMIAHQWRQPLTAISATSSTIEMKARIGRIDTPNIIEQSQKISQYAQHLSHTIDDFRDFFKPNKNRQEASFETIIDSVLHIIEVSIKNKNITIIKKIDSRDKFYTYTNELKQVILNLIKNAEDALIDNHIKEPYIKIEILTKGDDFLLKIRDNAGGIPHSIRDKIFDPYFSTKKEKNGTGLGLYMSKTIIEEHCKGELLVSNDTDGAVFTIILKGKETMKI